MKLRKPFVVILLLVILLGTGLEGAKRWDQSLASAGDNNLETIREAFELIQASNFKKVEPSALVEGAIKGMLDVLDDKHSAYFTDEQFRHFMESSRGSYTGIGAMVETKDGWLTIVQTFNGSPAAQAGLQAGDRVTDVDGKTTKDVSLDVAISWIRGPKGTPVTLSVTRSDGGTPRTLVLNRAEITVPSLDQEILEDGIGRIRLYNFSQNAPVQLRSAIDELSARGMKTLILDLRGNPGGLLDAAVKVADLFLPDAPIVHIVDREGASTTEMSDPAALSIPLIVLVDEFSASASEIVAGAVQDHGVGVIVGEPTFGKASVQTLYELDGGAGIKITVQKYLTPRGRSIEGEGIKPDVLVQKNSADKPKPLEPGRSLRYGFFGEDVQSLQRILTYLGYAPGSDDGIFGPRTSGALRTFQEARGLASSGVLDEKTRETLVTALDRPGNQAPGDPQLDKAVELAREKLRGR
ncbi:MAG: S41 family peptidase [Firmicutes bacterium]|nr:S41 family peptidase [Bacillota bacterium]